MRHYTQVTFRSYLCTLLMFLYNAKLHISFKNLCKILLCVNFTNFKMWSSLQVERMKMMKKTRGKARKKTRKAMFAANKGVKRRLELQGNSLSFYWFLMQLDIKSGMNFSILRIFCSNFVAQCKPLSMDIRPSLHNPLT